MVQNAQEAGQEIVVVMGVGFVGAVMAAIVADTVGRDGKPSKFVIGMQRPSVTELLEDSNDQQRHFTRESRRS